MRDEEVRRAELTQLFLKIESTQIWRSLRGSGQFHIPISRKAPSLSGAILPTLRHLAFDLSQTYPTKNSYSSPAWDTFVTGIAMPKTPMHKNSKPISRKSDVRRAPKITVVQSETIP